MDQEYFVVDDASDNPITPQAFGFQPRSHPQAGNENRPPTTEVYSQEMMEREMDITLSTTMHGDRPQQTQRENQWIRVVNGEFFDELGQLISIHQNDKVTVRLLPRIFIPDMSESLDPLPPSYYRTGAFLMETLPLDHVSLENVQPTQAEIERFKEVQFGDKYLPPSSHSFKAGDLVCDKSTPFNNIFQVKKTQQNQISVYPRGGDKSNLETKLASTLRRSLAKDDYALVLVGMHAGKVGLVHKIDTYFTIKSDSVDIRVLPEDLKSVHPWYGRRVHVTTPNTDLFGYVENFRDKIPWKTREYSCFEVKNEATGEHGWYNAKWVSLTRNFGSDSDDTMKDSQDELDSDADSDSEDDILFLAEKSTINHYMYGKEVTGLGIRGIVRDVRRISSKTTLLNVMSNYDHDDMGSWINEDMLQLVHMDEDETPFLRITDASEHGFQSVGQNFSTENLTQESLRLTHMTLDIRAEENDNHRNTRLAVPTPSTSSAPSTTTHISGGKRKCSSKTPSDITQVKKSRDIQEGLIESEQESDVIPTITRPSISDPQDKVVEYLLKYRKEEVNEALARDVVEKFVKQLTGKADLDVLMRAVSTDGVESDGCVRITRLSDGVMKVFYGVRENGKKKLRSVYQTVVSAQVWRWPDVTKRNLKHLPQCEHPDQLKGKEVCVNPYHFERIVADASDTTGLVEAALSGNYSVFKDTELARKYYLNCPICAESFSGELALMKHVQESHSDIPPHPCGISHCTKTFNTRQDKQTHRDEEHGKDPFECKEKACKTERKDYKSNFSTITRLLDHVTSVHGEKVKCPVCGHKFTYVEFPRHFRSHTAVKRYKCVIEGCVRAFLTESNLRKHYACHSDERPYKCDNCPAAFKLLALLTIHQKNKSCYRCGYEFVDHVQRDAHFKKQHQDQRVYEKMTQRISSLFHNLKFKTAAEQIEDFKMIYKLSDVLSKYHISRRKLYFGVLVPKNTENVRDHISDPNKICFGYIGRCSTGTRGAHLSKHHFASWGHSSVTKLHRLSDFKFIHVSDFWISDHGSNDLAREEAKKILQLFLFTVRYKREDLFFQFLELDPIFDLSQDELDHMLKQIEDSNGDLFSMPGFQVQFTKEYEFAQWKGKKVFFKCPNKCTGDFFSKSLQVRHIATCQKKPIGQTIQPPSIKLLSLQTIDKDKIMELINREPRASDCICYSIVATKQGFKTREELQDFLLNKDKEYQVYHGQNSSGEVSRYHFEGRAPSTLKNLASDKKSLYHACKFKCGTSEEMYKLESFLHVHEYLHGDLQLNRETLAIQNIVLYDISEKFSLEEWLEILDYSQNHYALVDPLPDFFHVTRVNLFKKLTVPVRKPSTPESTLIEKDESDNDYDEFDEEETEDVAAYNEEHLNAENELFQSIIEQDELKVNSDQSGNDD